jgi:DNA-binding GntR family transcriptional regulator
MRPLSLRNYVENYLREAILTGRFAPREKLVERELCELLQISRTSLREALRQLEAEKLIVNKLHQGPSVALVSKEDAQELYAVRALLESYAVELFTQNASDAQIIELGVAVDNLHRAGESGERKGLLHAKERFYNVILTGAANSLVRKMLTGMLTRVNMLRATSLSQDERFPVRLQEIRNLYTPFNGATRSLRVTLRITM